MANNTRTLTTWLLNNVDGTPDGARIIATDFAGIQAPKTSFLFTVEFQYRDVGDAYKAHIGHREMGEIRYDLKSATRPNVTMNQEDVNFYGYRAKITNRINYGTVTLTFYEDSVNRSNDLLWKYINLISPLTREPPTAVSAGDVTDDALTNFTNTVGALPDGAKNGTFASMKVHHHYISNDSGDIPLHKVTTYTYTNPKIESCTMSDLDMTTSEATTISVTFTVEAVNVSHSILGEFGGTT